MLQTEVMRTDPAMWYANRQSLQVASAWQRSLFGGVMRACGLVFDLVTPALSQCRSQTCIQGGAIQASVRKELRLREISVMRATLMVKRLPFPCIHGRF